MVKKIIQNLGKLNQGWLTSTESPTKRNTCGMCFREELDARSILIQKSIESVEKLRQSRIAAFPYTSYLNLTTKD